MTLYAAQQWKEQREREMSNEGKNKLQALDHKHQLRDQEKKQHQRTNEAEPNEQIKEWKTSKTNEKKTLNTKRSHFICKGIAQTRHLFVCRRFVLFFVRRSASALSSCRFLVSFSPSVFHTINQY